jgi:hypothetical protein
LSSTLQLEEEAVQLPPAPVLLVEWSPRWHEFVTSIKPALSRSAPRLAGEAPLGGMPLKGMVSSMLLEAFCLFVLIILPIKIAQLRPYAALRIASHDVIYYSGDELPRIEDLGGTQAGATGRAGGDEAHHRTQTIKIARGASLVPRVVDAPNLKLPASSDAVANLLAVKPNVGPPPLEGIRSARRAPDLSSVVAPAPSVIRDYTRNSISLPADAVVAPAPSVSRDHVVNAPTLNASVIAPAPNVSRDQSRTAPALGSAVIPPAPNVSRDRTLVAPLLTANVVAPAPSVTRDRDRSAPALSASVIAPAPSAVSRELSSAPVQMTNVAVVPPPVSAPEHASNRNSKLTLPAPSVIAPPPSSDVSQDMRRLASGSVVDPARAVVPPPPQPTGFMSSLIGKIFGSTDAVPPPPTVASSGTSGGARSALAANVVPPPPSVSAGGASGNPRGSRTGAGVNPGSNVVAPPPAVSASGSVGGRSGAGSTGLNPNVVAPPPSLSGTGSSGDHAGGSPGGTLLANNVVPPPPSLGGGSGSIGSGAGRKGAGLGGALDSGSPLAPAANGGSGNNAGAVISSDPGSKVGMPTVGGTGSLSMSPSGGDKTGLGGAGGGSSIGRGDGTGSGMKGAGSAAANAGPGRGADPAAHGGISPSPGPGGAGTAPGGTPAVPGVSVSGGSTIVTLPSFGSDAPPTAQAPGRSNAKGSTTLGVTVVATASSGGAFEPYKNLLRGEKYTTYVDTSLGPVVMEFADEAVAGHAFGATLTAPQAIRTDLPDGLPHARLSIKCTLDASGNLKNFRVLDAGPAEMTAKVVSAIRSWKFQPAMRGNQAVEVTAILGFGISTDDRF